MIFITDEMYSGITSRLFETIPEECGFFNGKIEYDTEAFYSTLTCSLLVYRCTPTPAGPPARIEKVVPVWWDFSTCAEGALQPNDFSWSEFTPFFPYHA